MLSSMNVCGKGENARGRTCAHSHEGTLFSHSPGELLLNISAWASPSTADLTNQYLCTWGFEMAYIFKVPLVSLRSPQTKSDFMEGAVQWGCHQAKAASGAHYYTALP